MGKDKRYSFADTERMKAEVITCLTSTLGFPQPDVEALFRYSLASTPSVLRFEGLKVLSPLKREELGEMVGIDDIVRRIWRVKDLPILHHLRKHIKFLLESPTISQTSSNAEQEKDWHNKIFELYFALILAPYVSSIDLDDPYHSDPNRRPDLIVEANGERWAFECKVIYSTTPDRAKTYLDKLEEAYDQLARAGASEGIPVVCFKNQVPLNELWPELAPNEYKVWETIGPPFSFIESKFKEIDDTLHKSFDHQVDLEKLLSADDGVGIRDGITPCSINIMLGTTAAVDGSGPTVMICREMALLRFADISSTATNLISLLQEELHQQP